MILRKATVDDRQGVWHIFNAVIQTGDTYVFRPDTPETDLEQHWFAPHMHTWVLESGGVLPGTYILKPNQIDLGAHVANASYMVHPHHQGRGIGKMLCEHSLQQAVALGFHSMQFNSVVSTNTAAIKLWKSFGFQIIGTVPKAFRHKKHGLVDTHIMHKKLK